MNDTLGGETYPEFTEGEMQLISVPRYLKSICEDDWAVKSKPDKASKKKKNKNKKKHLQQPHVRKARVHSSLEVDDWVT